ncbi:YidC/Oxa1 family membrane protein insertase [Roseivirga ehrenbergii]|uniref:Membrane protein insertase YidC n=1 Tax=Roseivirga ehrenbergii (strain DSM 102268 / JCM 13514 / KCTC 12282 / NCIMB 14502 / KMM 6017) TaxID=279360 RepID=A0A150XEF9_ROSEK|nr:membrane protein insertase YidC [Roseivirga ehrenbergii]KYG77088.1 membrane protein insertase YidC [Roseivirga ehrenbergii]TCL14406.1 YidC/Oxa1 family membrane protein insertase [Roseivirga ehrenbergii]
MDRNQMIGLGLIAALLITYAIVFKPPVTEEDLATPAPTEQAAVTPEQTTSQSEESNVLTDTIETDYTDKYGAFAAGAQGEATDLTIENEVAKFTFSSKGGIIKSVELKEFKTWDGRPLILIDEESTSQSLTLQTVKGNINIADLYFKASQTGTSLVKGDSLQFKYTMDLGSGNSIEQIYSIAGDSYVVGYEIKINGLNSTIIGEQMNFVWQHQMKRYEKNLSDSRIKSTIKWYSLAEDLDDLKASSSDIQQEQLTEPIKWLSFDQKFFNAGIISEKGFTGALVSTDVPAQDTSIVKNGEMRLAIPVADLYSGSKNQYYFGPNNYRILKKVTPGYKENIYLGYKMVSWVNKLIIIPLFQFLEKYISNYGVIIMIIVLIIKLALFPLTRKSYLSMAKMKALKPELDELKEKVGGDQQKMQQEQMKLYREMGVNPISGCIPMVLQMPILFAMFFFFPNSIELRGESFLWATDLSTYDVLFNLPFTIPFYGSHVSGFTLLMTVSTILYTWSNNQVSTVQGPMKSIGYFMPIIFMFVLNSYSSGLSFYYFVSNIITFGQQAIIRRFVDEDKIRATLHENKKKNANKGKSKFQQRLEDAMKASQEAQKQKRSKK